MQFVGETEWNEIKAENVIKDLEGSGYYKLNTAIETLDKIGYLRSPFAFYATDGHLERVSRLNMNTL